MLYFGLRDFKVIEKNTTHYIYVMSDLYLLKKFNFFFVLKFLLLGIV